MIFKLVCKNNYKIGRNKDKQEKDRNFCFIDLHFYL